MSRLMTLYRKTNGGVTMLPENEFQEYAALRKAEYQEARNNVKLIKPSAIVKPVKSDSGDIVGWEINICQK